MFFAQGNFMVPYQAVSWNRRGTLLVPYYLCICPLSATPFCPLVSYLPPGHVLGGCLHVGHADGPGALEGTTQAQALAARMSHGPLVRSRAAGQHPCWRGAEREGGEGLLAG